MIDISISLNSKNTEELSRKECKVMNAWREKEFGPREVKDFRKDYPDSTFFFVNQGNNILAFGTLVPIKIIYHEKEYNILGISNIISVEKGRGYGRMLVYEMIKHLEKDGKTGLGFCPPKVSEFYRDCGFNVKEGMIKRFQYKNPETGEIKTDDEGDGLYHEGPDGFIDRVLSAKDIVFIDVPFW